ncbi:MAG: DegV family protein [Clostridia bacterium]|nr:DegV family protein [Clostridia bacterium]
MSAIRFMTDSGSDLTPEQAEALGISLIPFPVTFGDQVYISGVDFDNERFYQMLADAPQTPTHSQITVYQFTEAFEQAYQDGVADLINTTINSEGSGTYNSACLAAQMFYEAHPEAEGKMRIHNLDSASYTCAYGYPVMEGARMAREGKGVEDILAFMRDWLAHSVIYFVPYTLKYAAKSGRIPSAAAFIGELVGLKPIMRIYDHAIVTSDKVRGEKKVIPALVKKATEEMQPNSPYMVISGDHPEVGDMLDAAMTAALGYPPAGRTQIGAVVSINSGPNVAAVMFHEK